MHRKLKKNFQLRTRGWRDELIVHLLQVDDCAKCARANKKKNPFKNKICRERKERGDAHAK